MKPNPQLDSLVIKKTKLSFIEGTKAYAQLRQEVTAAGILNRDFTYYSFLTLFLLIAYSLSIYALIISKSFLPIVLASGAVAFCAVQFGGLLHDAGHRAIFDSSKRNDLFGQFSALFAMIAYVKWRESHNRHHANTNEIGKDPDIDIPFHAFTVEQLKNLKGIGKNLTKYQHFIFYPARSFTFAVTKIDSWRYFTHPLNLEKLIPFTVFIFGLLVWFVVPFAAFPLSKAILFFIVANFGGSVYASTIFASNHKAMPVIPKGMKISFLEQQIETSRNVKPGTITDFIYMGLNYQIEHHLFPNCPRNKLKLLVPFAKSYCKKYHLEYTVDTFKETHDLIIGQLKHVESLVAA